MSRQYTVRKRTIDTCAARNLERPVKESVCESLENLSWRLGYDAVEPIGVLKRESASGKRDTRN